METPTTTSIPGGFADSFNALLTVWNQHQALRTDGATPSELFRSRASLDASRLSTARVSTARISTARISTARISTAR